jgi:hypothetical protein
MPQAVVGSLVSTGVSALAGSIFGGKSKKKATGFLTTTDAAIKSTPATGFNSTGGQAIFRRDAGTGVTSFDFFRSKGVDRALDDLKASGTVAARNFAGLRSQVAGGFSTLRQARMANLQRAEERSIGGLRESLRQRRLGGTSFENLAVAEERERFAMLGDEISAQTGIMELEMTRQLIDDEFQASMTGLAETLNQFNFETGIVAGLTQGATQLAGTIANARVGLSQAAANISADMDTGIGQAVAPFVKELGDFAGDFFDDVFKPDVGVGDITPDGASGIEPGPVGV